MLVDTQPATHQHVPASPEVRDEWIDSQLIGVLMDNASMALLAAVLVIPGLIFILWDQVATPLLLGWLGMALVVLYGRFKLLEVYRLRYDSVEGMQRQAFMRRYVWTWGAVGALWALPVAMTYLQTTLQTQFVVGLALMGYGLLSLTAFSAWAGAFHAYINSLVGTVMISLLGVQWWLGGSRQDYRMTMVLMFLLLVFWFLLRMAGQRLNQIHRSSFELQFSNQAGGGHQEPLPGIGGP